MKYGIDEVDGKGVRLSLGGSEALYLGQGKWLGIQGLRGLSSDPNPNHIYRPMTSRTQARQLLSETSSARTRAQQSSAHQTFQLSPLNQTLIKFISFY